MALGAAVVRMATLARLAITPHACAPGGLPRERRERTTGLRSFRRAQPRTDHGKHRPDAVLSFDQPLVVVGIAMALDLPEAAEGGVQPNEHGRRDVALTVLARGASDPIPRHTVASGAFPRDAEASFRVEKACGPGATFGHVVVHAAEGPRGERRDDGVGSKSATSDAAGSVLLADRGEPGGRLPAFHGPELSPEERQYRPTLRVAVRAPAVDAHTIA